MVNMKVHAKHIAKYGESESACKAQRLDIKTSILVVYLSIRQVSHPWRTNWLVVNANTELLQNKLETFEIVSIHI